MAFQSKKPYTPWHVTLASRINELCEKFGMDDLMTAETRDFVIGVAREQFKAGNNSGISWERKRAAGASRPAVA